MGRPKKIPDDHPYHRWYTEVLALVPSEKWDDDSNLAVIIRREGIRSPVHDYIHHVLKFVLRRIKPDTKGIPDLFTHSQRCLDGGVVVDGMYTCDKLGYWVCSHPDLNRRRSGHKLTVHKELQRIFCLLGNEAPAMYHRQGLVLRHTHRTTSKERALAGCGCANWTHTILGTQSQNSQDLMASEGGSTVCGFRRGEGNLNTRVNTNSTNENVNRIRIETWMMSCEAAPIMHERLILESTTVLERQDWSIDDRVVGVFSKLGGGTTASTSASRQLNSALSLAPLSGT